MSSIEQELRFTAKSLKNRIWLSSHVTNLSDNHQPNNKLLAFYQARLEGGVAAVVSEPVAAHPSSAIAREPFDYKESTLQGFRNLTELCHKYDALVIQPIYHVGAHGRASTALTAAWSPSGFPSARDQDGSHAMSHNELEAVLEGYQSIAESAISTGVDGIEIMAGGQLLIEQFWDAKFNIRTDNWSGSFEKRMAFGVEVLKRCRESIGPNRLLGITITATDWFSSLLSQQELLKIAEYYSQQGLLDYISFSLPANTGSLQQEDINWLQAIRNAVGSRCMIRIAGNVTSEAMINQLLCDDLGDFIGLVRPLLADPSYTDKIIAGIAPRPCVYCNQTCQYRKARDYTVNCLVNPECGRETMALHPVTDDSKSTSVVIAGGGLAGLEAAVSAASSGHCVTLYEASDSLGGQWSLAAAQPSRKRLALLLDWYKTQLADRNITVKLNTPLKMEQLQQCPESQVILATGSAVNASGRQRLYGGQDSLVKAGENDSVMLLDESFQHPWHPGDRVLILDETGHWEGLGTALYLIEQGCQVGFLTSRKFCAMELMALEGYQQFISQLNQAGTQIWTEAVMRSWHQGELEIGFLDYPDTETAQFDKLILSVGREPINNLETQLLRTSQSYQLAGDCQGARRAELAILEGRKAALSLNSVTTGQSPEVMGEKK